DGAERVGGRRCSIARDETFLAAHAPGERAWMHEAADVLTPRRAIEHMRARIERGHRRLEIEVHRKIQRARVARPRRDRARLQVYDRNDPSHGSSTSILTGDRAFCLPIALQSEDQGGAWRFESGRSGDTIRDLVTRYATPCQRSWHEELRIVSPDSRCFTRFAVLSGALISAASPSGRA